MKLIFCPSCTDLVRLFSYVRQCRCGESWGRYLDEVQAEIGGKAVAVGVDNHAFARAYRRTAAPWADELRRFSGWFMRRDEPHVTRAGGGIATRRGRRGGTRPRRGASVA